MLPRPNVGGRESQDAYSQWEYDTGSDIFERHFGSALLHGARLLDVGCGLGGKTVWYAESGARQVLAVDLAWEHVRQSVRFARARGQSERITVLRADAMRLPFADGAFDVVTANDSMEHFADPAAALRELARVLRPGGRLCLYFTPYRSPLGSHLYDYVKIPWCNVVLPRPLLYATLERAIRDAERAANGGAGADARAAEKFREIVRYYENDVNGITVRRFADILDATPGLRARRIQYEPPKFKFLRPLLRVPPLREYLAGLVFADLERTPAALSASPGH
jgi:ubiquinone/menaquinone biosynthesis C-methylase UbiE